MSDINRSKMIPLHVCDQAVAACNREIDKLQEENSGLRAAVESHERVDNLTIARLKAEVERLTNNCKYLDQKLDEELDNSAMLCGQVERLTKAGDAMVDWEVSYERRKKLETDWNAAKEGSSRDYPL